jgi:hypothetical protein
VGAEGYSGRLSSGILKRDRPTLIEIVVCALLLAATGALLFGSHIEHGGRYSDDWAGAAEFQFQADGDFGRMVDRFNDRVGARPLLGVSQAARHALWSNDLVAQHALAVALGGIASLLFFVLLRTLGMAAVWAGAAALLSFVFPWGDSDRLWLTGGPTQLCVIFYFAGCLTAARGIRTQGVPGGLWHAGAVGFYLLSVLVYEGAGVAILLTGLLYIALAGWRKARWRWAADVAVILPALVALSILHNHGPGARAYLSGLRDLPGEGTTAVLQALVPVHVGTAWRALIVVVGVGILVWAVRALAPAARRSLIPPTAAILVALLALGVAWLPFLGAGEPPTATGIDNRGNLLAAFVMALLVVAIGWLCAEIAQKVVRRQWAGPVAAVVVVATTGAGWLLIARSHADAYGRAADIQERILAGLRDAVPSPPPGATIFSLASQAQSARGVPVFSETWDLNGAVRLLWDDRTLHGFPIVGAARLRCGKQSVTPRSPRLQATAVLESGLGDKQAAAYGRAFIYDGRSARAFRVDDRIRCRELVSTIPAGQILEE